MIRWVLTAATTSGSEGPLAKSLAEERSLGSGATDDERDAVRVEALVRLGWPVGSALAVSAPQ